jgi:hypothetical protein
VGGIPWLEPRMMHFRLQNGGRPCSPDCRLYIQLGGKGSPGFDTKFVVYSYSQPLLAADIAFCGLHRYMPEEKLDLLKLASRIVAEPRTGLSEIMRRET